MSEDNSRDPRRIVATSIMGLLVLGLLMLLAGGGCFYVGRPGLAWGLLGAGSLAVVGSLLLRLLDPYRDQQDREAGQEALLEKLSEAQAAGDVDAAQLERAQTLLRKQDED